MSITRTLFIPVFVKVLDDDESTTYQSKLRIRLIIVHIYIRHILTTITFNMTIRNNTKITVEMDLSCPDPTSFQMIFLSEVGGRWGYHPHPPGCCNGWGLHISRPLCWQAESRTSQDLSGWWLMVHLWPWYGSFAMCLVKHVDRYKVKTELKVVYWWLM